jgi:hypothetical protein
MLGYVIYTQVLCSANSILRYLQVDPTKLACLANWTRDNTMETVLIELRR